MAYASVASLLQTIDLVNYHGDSSISSRFNHQITFLHQHTSFLQSFLENGDPNRAKNWEETIREVTDRAEEIIDLLVSDHLLKSSSGSKPELDYSFDELEEVTEEMESIANRVKGRSTKPEAEPHKDLPEIVARLCHGSDWLETIAILGLPGTGKSSLARNAYNHPSTVKHFDVRISATVSIELSPRGVMLDLLRALNKSEIEITSSSDRELIGTLYRSLEGKRYLIVLYDVRNRGTWDMLRLACPTYLNGGRIILTTTDWHVARRFSDHVYEMRLLDEDQSWDLLREKIFRGDPCPSQLEYIGKVIARRCQGVLLSIELVSIILCDDQTEAAWEDVAESIADFLMESGRLKQILHLSYTLLPHHLRPCFLYMSPNS